MNRGERKERWCGWRRVSAEAVQGAHASDEFGLSTIARMTHDVDGNTDRRKCESSIASYCDKLPWADHGEQGVQKWPRSLALCTGVASV